jgi:RecG-like helicase
VYPATEGLSFKQIRTLVESHLDALLPLVAEHLPRALLEPPGVPELPEALRMVHRPASIAEAAAGRARLAYEELLSVHILHRRANALAREHRAGVAMTNRRELTSRLKASLPFDLTGAQTRSLREIVADMTSDRRMHRLLQGDVGSGKTIVALFASLLAMENGFQAAVMAPTELLAEQHHRTFARLLEPLGIQPLLVTGRQGAPPGRRPITSALRPESARARVLAFVDAELAKGRQAYVVYPLVDESEKTDLKAATVAHEELTAGALAHRRVGLLHGRMPGDEKDAVMRAFRDGELDVLVATTVIEVGIDVANATVMLIEHPERFGLSQLHQLRGRVGRGGEQSYCVLLGDVGPEAAERLRLFVSTEDGFEIARADMRLRGMGDLFGERQSGEPTFRVADPLRDEELNLHAREAAERLLDADPELARPEHQGLRQTLGTRYARSLELFRVG